MSEIKSPGKLYLVPTPIGNLEDMTFRAVRILKTVSLVACEDTRTSGILLSHYGIDTPRTSLHAHNEHSKVPRIVEKMILGDDVAIISDAGSPGISDPGYLLTRAALDAHLQIEALPGPTAMIPALAASGLPTDKFVFEGFLPQKKGRQTRIQALIEEDRTVIFYESPHRLGKLIEQLRQFAGDDRQAVIARELTKKFEEYVRGSLAELAEWVQAQPKIRGEIVFLLGSQKTSERINP